MTIKEIAALAGVSISTVSKIINNKDLNINPETRNRVLKIVKEYNYTPYGMIKNTSSSKNFVLGVLLCNSGESPLMLNGILAAAQENGYSVMVLDSQNSVNTELKNISVLCKNNVDGVIWEPVQEDSVLHEHYLNDLNIPVCYINNKISTDEYYIDFAQMGYFMAQKLIEYKHSKIACIIKKSSRRSQLVLEGFKKCLYDNQIAYNDKMVFSVEDEDYIQKIITHEISGIICSHFASALVLYGNMTKLRHYIPSDLSLVSLKDDARDPLPYPKISTVSIPYKSFGSHVCQCLIAECEKSSMHMPPFSPDYVFDNEDSLSSPYYYRTKKIVVVGSINIDCTFNVDFLPQAGKTTKILNSAVTLGGKGANQAIGVSKLGREVSLIGRIGNDPDSDFIFNVLEEQRVSTQGIHRDSNTPTGRAYIYIENHGESSITVLSGANGNLTPDDIIKQQHLYRNAGYCLLSAELPLPVIIEAARTGRKYGAQNILKPATLKNLPEELIENIDIFIPNRKEAATLCPHYNTIEDQADYFGKKGIPVVIITLGHKGCYLRTPDKTSYYPASAFTSIDSTGGADAFIAALASYMAKGFSLEKSVQIANYAAGFCVSRLGVSQALVDQITLETHIGRLDPALMVLKS
ncbi:transcriptional regulator, LacI family [Anaerocolumna xylanovorans DSM 12503]|uniref:Ribokinase n=2 Tax=Anaerocolumna TaxID=1843210 RepID=A0A1M7Y2A9_9FIRM|nr:transcriptional regulator, LacI family [Anaerocolumna xylanovorans DSM 12503]